MKRIVIALISIATLTMITACANKEIKIVAAPKQASVEQKKEEIKEAAKKVEDNKSDMEQENKDKLSKENKTDNLKTQGENVQAKGSSIVAKSSNQGISNTSYKLKNNIIVIDPGHANKADLGKEPEAPNSSKLKYKQTGGADGVVTKTPEYKINMQVAKKLKSKLEEKGYTVIITKTENNKTMSNIERAKVGNEANAGLVIRIHADSADNSSTKGASMLVPGKNEYTKEFYDESKLFGKIILNTLTNEVGMKNRGVIERDDITGFNWSTVPVVLVEMGFLSNSDEDKLLSSNDYQEKIADALTKGITSLGK